MENKKEFGIFIRDKRQEKGLSQKDLAEMLYVTESAISKWERGISYPDITLVSEICKALSISEHELVTASNDVEYRKIKTNAKKFEIINNVYFLVPTLSYLLTIIICFICNLAVSGTLSWFFIVLTSLLCAFSFVPGFYYFFEKNKLSVFIFTSAAAVSLLLITCGVYTKTAFWVPTAIVGTLMGYTLFFMPILLSAKCVSPLLKKCRFLLTTVFLILFTCILLLAVFGMIKEFNLKSGVLISLYCFAPLLITTLVCLIKMNGFLKAGISIAVFGGFSAFVEEIIVKLFGEEYVDNVRSVDFTDWAHHVNGNVRLIIMISFAAVSLVFLAVGVIKSRKKA